MKIRVKFSEKSIGDISFAKKINLLIKCDVKNKCFLKNDFF